MTRTRTPLRTLERAHSEAGFSFLELVIVTAIVAVLVGGMLVAVSIVQDRAPVLETKTTLSEARHLVEDFGRTFEQLPPTQLAKLGVVTGRRADGVRAPNHLNEGIETVRRAASVPGYRGRTEFLSRTRCNTDEDHVDGGSDGQDPLEEIRDAWHNPVVYIAGHDYVRAAEGGVAYVNRAGETVIARPYRTSDGDFARPQSFQVFSMGPDGEPNTPDDVLGWER